MFGCTSSRGVNWFVCVDGTGTMPLGLDCLDCLDGLGPLVGGCVVEPLLIGTTRRFERLDGGGGSGIGKFSETIYPCQKENRTERKGAAGIPNDAPFGSVAGPRMLGTRATHCPVF